MKRFKKRTYLVIVESPSKCSKIEEFLGAKEYQCIASYGHIREISAGNGKNALSSILLSGDGGDGGEGESGGEGHRFHDPPLFSMIAAKRNHVERLRAAIAMYPRENIYLATDDDREGESIAYHICMAFQLDVRTTKRILFREITASALQHSIRNPGIVDMAIVHSQYARQVLDRLIGFRISPILWTQITPFSHRGGGGGGGGASLSAGRCQTPALRFIYENYVCVTNSVAKFQTPLSTSASSAAIYHVEGCFTKYNWTFELDGAIYGRIQEDADDNEMVVSRFLERSKTFVHELTMGEPHVVRTKPPAPFNTSGILQYASDHFSFSPKKTMTILQDLYEDGYITYMRTENTKYCAEFVDTCFLHIECMCGGDRRYLGAKHALVTSSAKPHEAIRATNLSRSDLRTATATAADADKGRLYHSIWQRSIVSCMSDSVYVAHPLTVSSPHPQYVYKKTLMIPDFLGFEAAVHRSGDKDKDKDKDEPCVAAAEWLREYQRGSGSGSSSTKVACRSIRAVDATNEPVSAATNRYYLTDASLIRKLEEWRIGKPSTYVLFLETIRERGYVTKSDLPGVAMPCTDFHMSPTTTSCAPTAAAASFFSPAAAAAAAASSSYTITSSATERVYGAAKNRYVMTPLGILVIEFLIESFGSSLFSFEYSRRMEAELDDMAANKNWTEVCEHCYRDIETCIAALAAKNSRIERRTRCSFPVVGDGGGEDEDGDTESRIAFHPDGSSFLVSWSANKKPEISAVRSDLLDFDLEMLRRGEYRLENIVKQTLPDSCLGRIADKEVHLFSGRYGKYIELRGEDAVEKISVEKHIAKDILDIRLDDIVLFLESRRHGEELHMQENENILRVIEVSAGQMSIRKGKSTFPDYLFWIEGAPPAGGAGKSKRTTKTGAGSANNGTKPQFYSLKTFRRDTAAHYLTCDPQEVVAWATAMKVTKNAKKKNVPRL